jgi:UDP-N-acetylmuramyl pentapeptide phosphotransferase/UDP-N-acetylglucosamine-1-phosphate transferase
MALIAFSLTGSLLAFLRYNFPPARIFMGDTGSLLVGMILSILAINLIRSGLVTETINLPNKGPLLAMAFLSIPLFDSLRVFLTRISKGHHPLYPGRGHVHHALLDLGIGHKKTAFVLYLVSVVLIFGAYFLLNLNINISIAILGFISFILLVTPFYLLRKRKK